MTHPAGSYTSPSVSANVKSYTMSHHKYMPTSDSTVAVIMASSGLTPAVNACYAVSVVSPKIPNAKNTKDSYTSPPSAPLQPR